MFLEVRHPDLGRRHESLVGLLVRGPDADVLELPHRIEGASGLVRFVFRDGQRRDRRKNYRQAHSRKDDTANRHDVFS